MAMLRHAPGPAEMIVDDRGEPVRVRLPRMADVVLAALRIVAGLMFVQHGVQKHFGLLALPEMPAWSGPPAAFSVMWVAGTLEIAGGILLALGVLTRVVGFLLSGMMAVAYFTVHAPQDFFPVINRGELAALYCFVFLTFAALGGGRYSLDGWLKRRRIRAHSRERDAVATGSVNADVTADRP